MFTVLYADTVKMGDRITPLLGTSPFERADTWGWWREALRRADVGIAAVRELGHEETRRLRAPANGSIADPPCVVVVPLSIGSVQRRRSFDPVRLRVVWLEELEDRLPRVLRELRGAHGNPLRSLGERIIAEHRPRLVVTKAVSHICNVGDARQSPPPPPPDFSSPTRPVALY